MSKKEGWLYKSFKLGDKKYRIKYKNNEMSDELGRCYPPVGQIDIKTHWDGVEIPRDSLEQTLYHEIVHAIMAEMGINDHDEQFVQTMAVMIHQVFNTIK